MNIIQKALEKMSRKGDGDTIDRLSATTTTMMLAVFSLVTTAGLMVDQPMKCFVPAEMKDGMKDYMENYCYAQGSYFLAFEKRVPVNPEQTSGRRYKSVQHTGEEMISYYQWVPLILVLQAVMFYTPRLFWRVASNVSGVNFNGMLTMARQCLKCDGDKREQHYRSLADYVNWALNLHQAARRSSTWQLYERMVSLHMIGVFLLSKMLYVANAVGQIYLLDTLLQTNDTLYGITMIKRLVNGTQWQSSGFFPRSTLCNVEIREIEMGVNLRRYTIQCVLVINLFNEKLFIFLWFWIMFVAVVSSCSLLYYLIVIGLPGNRRRFIRHLLPMLPIDKDQPLASFLPKFVHGYLGLHGVFLLRSINERVGSIVASKVATYMWNDFIEESDRPKVTVGSKGFVEESGHSRVTVASKKTRPQQNSICSSCGYCTSGRTYSGSSICQTCTRQPSLIYANRALGHQSEINVTTYSSTGQDGIRRRDPNSP